MLRVVPSPLLAIAERAVPVYLGNSKEERRRSAAMIFTWWAERSGSFGTGHLYLLVILFLVSALLMEGEASAEARAATKVC